MPCENVTNRRYTNWNTTGQTFFLKTYFWTRKRLHARGTQRTTQSEAVEKENYQVPIPSQTGRVLHNHTRRTRGTHTITYSCRLRCAIHSARETLRTYYYVHLLRRDRELLKNCSPRGRFEYTCVSAVNKLTGILHIYRMHTWYIGKCTGTRHCLDVTLLEWRMMCCVW